MTKFEKAIESCKNQMKNCGIRCDISLLEGVAKSLGPALYNADARFVAATNKKELATIERNFINKKLGVTGPRAEKAMNYAIIKLGHSNRHKMRAVFYYLVVKNLKLDSKFTRGTKRKAA